MKHERKIAFLLLLLTVGLLTAFKLPPIAAFFYGTGGTVDVNNQQVAGSTLSVNNGTTDGGTQRVTLSSDSTGQVALTSSRTTSVTLQNAAVANGNGTTLNTAGMSSAILTVNCSSCSGGTTVNFEGTEDGSNYFSLNGVLIGTSTIASATTTAGLTYWELQVANAQNVRARISAYSAGTITVTGHTSPMAWNDNGSQATTNTGNADAGTLRVALATNQPNLTTALNVSAANFPATVDTNKGSAGASTIRTIEAAGTPVLENALSTTVQTVVAAAANLDSVYCYNPNASVAYIQVFDISGTVTLGTSTPKFSFGIPATNSSGATNLKAAFANAIKVAATTTATGSTAPGSALDCNVGYR